VPRSRDPVYRTSTGGRDRLYSYTRDSRVAMKILRLLRRTRSSQDLEAGCADVTDFALDSDPPLPDVPVSRITTVECTFRVAGWEDWEERGTGSRAVNFHPGEREADPSREKINADRVAA